MFCNLYLCLYTFYAYPQQKNSYSPKGLQLYPFTCGACLLFSLTFQFCILNKPFDKVYHKILIGKLFNYRIKRKILFQFKNNLTRVNCMQQLLVKEETFRLNNIFFKFLKTVLYLYSYKCPRASILDLLLLLYL